MLFESMAINLYLAKKYGAGSGIAPATLEEDALATQWSFWVMTEIEKPLLVILLHTVGMVPAGEERRLLPRDRRPHHQPPLRIAVERRRPVQHRAVVPDDDVVPLPRMPVDEGRLRRMRHQRLDQRAARGVVHPSTLRACAPRYNAGPCGFPAAAWPGAPAGAGCAPPR